MAMKKRHAVNKKKKKKLKGVVSSFMSRTYALHKLQIGSREFRKLCILKGVFPREPRHKKIKNKNKTYYLTKDINFLSHDPLISSFREFKTWREKLRRSQIKKDYATISTLRRNKPSYRLDNVVLQRYPTFQDALKDLDDALCMIHLFAYLPQTAVIKASRVKRCERMCREFQNYVLQSRSLKKTFLSVKGKYYQAEIMGNTITWLVPYKFTPELPKTVDFRVMVVFLEFYEALMGFVLFRLYNSIGLVYPPPISSSALTPGLASLISKPIQEDGKIDADAKVDEDEDEDDDIVGRNEQEMKNVFADDANITSNEERIKEDKFANLFSGFVFYLSREVPRESLEFVIRSFGGKVSWTGSPLNIEENAEEITHQIVDRPTQGHKYLTREYIQPQWIYDCINAGIILPVHEYAIGAKLPHHLSPFVDDEKEGYIPSRREKLNQLLESSNAAAVEDKKDTVRKSRVTEEDEMNSDYDTPQEDRYGSESEEEEEEEEAGDQQDTKESTTETPAKKQVSKEVAKKRRIKHQKIKEERTQIKFQKMMVPRKKKLLYDKLKRQEKREKKVGSTLQKKRDALEQKNQS